MTNITQQEIDNIIRNLNNNEDMKNAGEQLYKRLSVSDILELKTVCEILGNYKLKANNNDHKVLQGNSFVENTSSIIKRMRLSKFYEWYMNNHINIIFNSFIRYDNAYAELDFDNLGLTYSRIEIPPIPSTMQMSSLLHELGHIAYYMNKKSNNFDCFEYAEVIPFLLEYLYYSLIGRIEDFEKTRTIYSIYTAKGFLRTCKLNPSNIIISEAIQTKIYLKSADISYQLIDQIDNNEAMLKYIDDVLAGDRMLKEINNFNIQTTGFDRLVSSVKTLGKRR